MDLKKNKHGWSKITPATIVGVILLFVFATALLNMLPTQIDSMSTAVGAVITELNDSDVYGTGPATFADNMGSNLGWFWVVGAFVAILTVILGIFGLRSYMRKKRGY